MNQEIFSDGVGQVTVIGGVVRLDFVSYSPVEKDAKGQPAAVFRQRVVMSLDGFLQSAAKIQEAAQAVLKLAQRSRDAPVSSSIEIAAATPADVSAQAERPAPTVQKRPFP